MRFFLILILFAPLTLSAQNETLKKKIDLLADKLEPKVIEWRRHVHQYPELSNREFKTARLIAAHLISLGIEVDTGVAHTGVVGILKGAKPGPVVALRADMDALPVTERVDLPFASKVKSEYNNEEVGVMHACGHDTHVAILMGVAELLSSMKADLKGTVKFIFQPAEEGAPDGEEGGAELMVKEGVLDKPKVDVVFGLHIDAQSHVGQITYRPGGLMAAVDELNITVKGKQTHGAYPWLGVDPIVTSSQIIMGLQTIISRQVALVENPAVITIGSIHGGNRSNIIPEEVKLVGTVRTLDTAMQTFIHKKIRQTVSNIAEAAGAEVQVEIIKFYPVTYNDPALTAKMLPSLQQAAGVKNVKEIKPELGAEDFSFFAQKVPGLYFVLGGAPLDKKLEDMPAHHTPDFFIDESGLKLGLRSFCYMVIDYTNAGK